MIMNIKFDKTWTAGVFLAGFNFLVAAGVIGPEEAAEYQGAVEALLDNLDVILMNAAGIAVILGDRFGTDNGG